MIALNIDGCYCFRVGRHLPTLYAQWGAEPSKDDTYLAVFDADVWATDVTAAMNTNIAEKTGQPQLTALGRLLYPVQEGPLGLDDFVGVAVSPAAARYITRLATNRG